MKTYDVKCGEPVNTGCAEHDEGVAGNGNLSSVLTGKAKQTHADPVERNDSNIIWKDIKGYEGRYQVSNTGLIKSLQRHVENGSDKGMILPERILKPNIIVSGYHAVRLQKDGIGKQLYVHKLVADAFLNNDYASGYVVNHKDGNKGNNNVENLEYVSYSENNQHAWDNGLRKSNKHRFTADEVIQIRIEAESMSRKELAIKYGVYKTVIDSILTYKTWKNI